MGGVEHRYTWQGGKLIAEYWDGGKAMEFFYGPDGSIDGFNYKASANGSRNSYYYVKNLQGDVVAIVNKNGEVKAEYTYDPFGKVLSVTNASGTSIGDTNPIRYRSYYYDSESGFYYLQSRYYDPNLCRFINADGLASTGQGFLGCNMFAYCNNTPVCCSDPSGTLPWYIDENGNDCYEGFSSYDRAAAVAYAKKWYNSFNYNYYRYRSDCTNFISQCLIAGGISQTESWYMTKTPKSNWSQIYPPIWYFNNLRYAWDAGTAWRKASALHNYFCSFYGNKSIHISSTDGIADAIQSYNIQPGDLMFFANEDGLLCHSSIITKIDDQMIYYAGHTEPRFNEPLFDHFTPGGVYVLTIHG